MADLTTELVLETNEPQPGPGAPPGEVVLDRHALDQLFRPRPVAPAQVRTGAPGVTGSDKGGAARPGP